MTLLEKQCVEIEIEYREWREAPAWYCVKTTLYNDGRIESEIMADEKTKLPIVLHCFEKPLDGTFETVEATTYYTYLQGFNEAERQLRALNL